MDRRETKTSLLKELRHDKRRIERSFNYVEKNFEKAPVQGHDKLKEVCLYDLPQVVLCSKLINVLVIECCKVGVTCK